MPNPSRDDAKRLGKKYDEDQVIIFFIDRDSDEMGYASYGKDKSLCDRTKEMADHLYTELYDYLRSKV